MLLNPYRFGTSPSGFVANVLADSPVGFWRLNESSGTSAANQVGGGPTGIYSSFVTTLHASGGPVSGGGYITTGQPANLNESPGVNLGLTTNYAGECTLMMAVSLAASQPAARPHLFTKNWFYSPGTNDFPIGLMTDASRNLFFRLSSGDDFSYDLQLAGPTLAADTWYLVHAVYRDSGLCEIYVDGVQEASSTIGFSISSPSTTWRVGSASDFSSGATQSTMNGGIAEVALFPSALSSTRIAAHFAASGL